MCQRVLISKNIRSISTRSFESNLEAASGMGVSLLKLTRLNRSIDSLYELLYSQFNDITAEDYKTIGPQLTFLLQTVKNLYQYCKSLKTVTVVNKEIENLWHNYSALYELKGDLEKFRLNPITDCNLSKALSLASSHINKL